MKEPPRNKTGMHVIPVYREKYLVAYSRAFRGRNRYQIVWPTELQNGELDWEQCVEICQFHYVSTHKRPRRRGKLRIRKVGLKKPNFDRGNSIGRSDFKDWADLTFSQSEPFDINRFEKEYE